MIKSSFAVLAVALVGLFGYNFATTDNSKGNVDRAKDAAAQVGDTVRDKGLASFVELRLKTSFGFDATRFVHVFYDEGRAVVYGMVPESVDLTKLREQALAVSGVREVEVLLNQRPEFIASLKSIGGTPAPKVVSETP